ncbi:hypothetical protein [uncultured Sphingomonas sp.]|uniref:hypothetical protein n=1 Tax=uncultured Sphingomonas sp. TaxID=158754 RepID=UPI0025EE5C22|nr:hypothetical protein [uncultured Sphingomonas sp.]
MMNVLVVEDDEFKAADIVRLISEAIGSATITRAASVTSALRAITAGGFPLVILDMSLPTFDLSGPGGGGSPQSQGGVEVLRLASRLASECVYLVVTQYPDIEIDGREVPLAKAAKQLSSRFKVNVKECLLYEFDRDDWQASFSRALTFDIT